jgi:hypothetical protein
MCFTIISMEINIVEVTSRKLLRTFIHLPAKLHKDDPYWMPTIYTDDFNFFNPLKIISLIRAIL